MNQHFRPPRLPATTNAAEGWSQRRYTIDEIEAVVTAGNMDFVFGRTKDGLANPKPATAPALSVAHGGPELV